VVCFPALKEIKCALGSGRPIQLLVEADPRFHPFSLSEFKSSEEYNAVPPEVSAAIEEAWTRRVYYRRRAFEADAMVGALCGRLGLVLAWTPPTLASLPREVTVFLLCNEEKGGELLTDLEDGLAPGRVRLTRDPSMLPTADKVLLLLTGGVLEPDSVSLGQLEAVIQTDSETQKDRMVALFSTEAGWQFGCDEHRGASKAVKESLDSHEAITFRRKDAGGPCEHEFTAMCAQLEHKLLLGLG